MIGKRVSGDLYIHRISLSHLTEAELSLVTELNKKLHDNESDWNVVRLSSDNVAFLLYQKFEDYAFPELLRSTRIDLIDGRKSVRDFSTYQNPPILHRKELLLPADAPNRECYSKLTKELDELGLFYETNKIGFKNQWLERLKKHGIIIKDHLVLREKIDISSKIERHKTAIVRYQLSQPVQILYKYNLLTEQTSFFDYGCGRGDDIETLAAEGFQANGWDPHFAPDAEKIKSDVVNIGFVLNVIERQEERREALLSAWRLTKKVLAVAVILHNAASTQCATPYKDGFITTRKTFQKYFTQEQLRDFITDTLGIEPIAVSSGIFFVFADEVLQQEYQIQRFQRISAPQAIFDGNRSRPRFEIKIDRFLKVEATLQELSREIEFLGRTLAENEIPTSILDELKVNRISIAKSQEFCLEKICDKNLIEKSAQRRKEDLILYFAIEIFSKHKAYRHLPARLQADIKCFWGSYKNAQDDAMQLLFSTGNRISLGKAVVEAISNGFGHLSEEEQFQFHGINLTDLPVILRCYVACGSILYGDADQADLIKIHLNTSKLTLLYFENFEDLIPRLKKRVKINLSDQKISTFYTPDSEKQYLYQKSLYLHSSHERYDRQKMFDELLAKKAPFDFHGHGPSAAIFDAFLSKLGL